MRVLLTRAAEDSARTGALLEAAAYEVVVSPVIEIKALPAVWPDGAVDAVLATSANAFVSGSVIGPAPEARRVMTLFLVGERTAAGAREHGYLGAATVTANAAALALAFGTLAHRPRRLVYLAGRDRKPDAEAALSSAGQAFEVLEIYEARGAAALSERVEAALRAREVDAVLHYSRRSASLFSALATARGLDISGLRHLCLSEDVAATLRERSLPHVEVAEAPNEPALLALLGG